jgi:integrase
MPSILTENAIRAANPNTTLWDSSVRHFGLRVTPAGAKSFIVLLGSGRRRAIGRYPTITLAQARVKARQILAEKTLGRFQEQTVSWAAALDQFLAFVERKNRSRTHKEYKRALNRYFPFGTTRLAEITRDEIARRLDKLADTPAQQGRALVYCKTFFNWSVKRGYLDRNPCTMAAMKSPSRSRTLTDDELKRVWVGAEECGQFGIIVKLLILTGQRRGEIAALRKEWICNDTITLPKEITKNAREHMFPIGRTTQFVLVSPNLGNPLIFPARGNPTKPFNGWSKSKVALDKASGVSGWALHDLRRTFATRLADLLQCEFSSH